jgi:hypothetical protein
VAITSNASFITNRFSKSLAQGDANIFHGVVIIDMGVAFGYNLEVNHSMASNLVKHMVQKGDARGQFSLTGSIQVNGDLDFGFRSVPGNVSLPHTSKRREAKC